MERTTLFRNNPYRLVGSAFIILSLLNATSRATADVTWDNSNVVSWDIVYDVSAGPGSAFSSMDQDTGILSITPPFGIVAYQSWFGLGNVFSPLYVNGSFGAFWDGINGVSSTDPTLGIAPDYDGGGSDDFYIVQTSGSIADFTGAGAFTLTIPMASDPIDYYNIGTFTNSTDPMFVTGTINVIGPPNAVPEPSSVMVWLFLGLTGIVAMRKARRHRGNR